MKNPALLPFLFIGLALIVCVPGAFIFGHLNTREYLTDGIPVTVSVTEYEVIGSHADVYVKYQAENGEWIRAYVTNYGGGSPYLGETFTAYMLPEQPEELYRESDTVTKVFVYALCIACIAGGFAVIIAAFHSRADYRLLKKHGVEAYAEIYEVTVQNAGKKKLVYPAKYRFIDDEGGVHGGTHTFTYRAPEYGEKYPVVYVKKRSGKYISSIL